MRKDADGASENVVPEIVTACPGASLVLPMMKPVAEFTVYVFPPNVKLGTSDGLATKGIVTPFETRYDADGPSDSVAPETVTAAPGKSIVPEPIPNAVAESAVYVRPSNVNTGLGVCSAA